MQYVGVFRLNLRSHKQTHRVAGGSFTFLEQNYPTLISTSFTPEKDCRDRTRDRSNTRITHTLARTSFFDLSGTGASY